jgi:hypothetical protein
MLPGAEHGMALSDDFSTDRMGVHWAFHAPGAGEAARVLRDGDGLVLKGSGASPTDSRPLTFICGDLAMRSRPTSSLRARQRRGCCCSIRRSSIAGLGFRARAGDASRGHAAARGCAGGFRTAAADQGAERPAHRDVLDAYARQGVDAVWRAVRDVGVQPQHGVGFFEFEAGGLLRGEWERAGEVNDVSGVVTCASRRW